MSQVPVKYVSVPCLLDKQPTTPILKRPDNKFVPVVPLSALREVVEDLKRIQALAKQDHTGPLDPFGDLIRIEDVTQRLLASLVEQ